jgi:hypothetical protein
MGSAAPVTALAVAFGGDGAWAANSNGLARLRSTPMALVDKATTLEAQMSPWFDRHGLVGDIDLLAYGDMLNYTGSPNDNNGVCPFLSF